MSKKLYVVATPIGNLKDITERAIETLKNADLILCEDTRVTLKIVSAFNIKTKLISCHKYNEISLAGGLEKLFDNYNQIALVSDAGTPAISDPGAAVVKEAIRLGIEVVAVPGASALAASISISGSLDNNYVFLGFLERDNKKQISQIKSLATSGFNTFIIYESPNRIIKTLNNFKTVTVNEISVFNDITKLHERSYHGSLKDVIKMLEENENAGKGEYVFIISLQTEIEVKEELSLEALIINEIVFNNVTSKTAIANLTKKGLSKNELYKASLNLKNILL